MRISKIKKELGRALFLIRHKGFRYTYNKMIWLKSLYGRTFLSRLIFYRLFPIFGNLYPRLVEVEVTTRCNLKCKMCENAYWTQRGQDMSFEQFKGIIDQFPKLRWIGMTGIGTSFLNKDFMKMLEYVKEKDPAISIELFDTFYFIDEKRAKKIVEMGVDFFYASIDGATKETYEKIRIGSDFDRVMKNLETLIKIKKEKGSYFPEIAFHFIISRDNVHEIPMFVDVIANRFGADNIDHIFFTRVLHVYDEIKDIVVDVPEELVCEANEKASRYGIELRWNKNIPSCKPPTRECTVWVEPFIFVDGTVVPCCAANEANKRAFQKEHSMGNVFEQSFKDIWHGEKYTQFRKKLHSGTIPVQCTICPITDLKGKEDVVCKP